MPGELVGALATLAVGALLLAAMGGLEKLVPRGVVQQSDRRLADHRHSLELSADRFTKSRYAAAKAVYSKARLPMARTPPEHP